MPAPSFVHLRLHSEYSIVDGIVRIEEAVAAAAADGMPALALTDLSNVFGLVKFYKEARVKGVKPVIGCDLWLENEADRDKPYRMLLLCQSRAGYLKLCELVTRAYRTNQYRGRPEFKRGWFAEGTDGLIALSGAHHGDLGQALAADNLKQAQRLAAEWGKWFPGRFYIEIQRLGKSAMVSGAAGVPVETYVQRALALASKAKLPVVATHPVQFVKREDFRAHEARVCIAQGYTLSDQRRPKAFLAEQYFRSQAEMAEAFADVPQALANSVEIARRCNLSIELGKTRLPQFKTPGNVSLEEHLRARAHEGLERRASQLFADAAQGAKELPRYRERLEFEINTIQKMGFPGYFLIVADFINWAKQNGVPVGPGRGSGAGSLVAYSLGITDLDPLRYDLLFERFLNPERVSMPDFDIDFCQDGRDRVIEYVRDRYGADSVSQIVTFGTMAARAVVRDVGRVLDLSYTFCDQLAKLIPFQPGRHITLQDAREMEPQLKEREKNEEEVRELLALAEQLEGLTRNVGMHAGGVLIAPGKLTDFCPLYMAEGSESAVSQFDMKDVEAAGLVKFDFLGLTTLTILDWTLKYIKGMRAEGGKSRDEGGGMRAEGKDAKQSASSSSLIPHPSSLDIDLSTIPLDDPAAYRIFSSADTTGVFQFESRGMRDLLARAKPDRFEDIVALVALYRPGPMELIPEFIRRKHGGRVDYPDPRVEPILKPTYGIMVYQEQVMQIAQIIGGYSLGGADLLRRAMGKKLPEEMAQHRGLFVKGAQANAVADRKANEIFDLMEKFAGYGFNRSHAAAYALVAYQTAYFKAHHMAAFIAANMSAVMNDTDKVKQFVDDARAHEITVRAPDVNDSNYRFEPVDARTIRYGLGGIKGTGEGAIESIIAARKAGGPFKDLFDFCHRVDKRLVNRRVVESLVRAGAFDAIDGHRASLLSSVGMALESAEQASRAVNQVSLFGDLPEAAQRPALTDVPRWGIKEQLQNEKLALGFYLSGDLFNVYRDEVRRFVRMRIAEVAAMPAGDFSSRGQKYLVAGIVMGVRINNTASGRMGIVTLADDSEANEVVFFGEVFDKFRQKLKEDELLVMEVELRARGGGGRMVNGEFESGGEARASIRAVNVLDLNEARVRFARGVRIICNGGSSGAKLKDLLAPYRSGRCPVSVVYANRGGSCEIDLGEAWRVNPHEDLIRSLRDWLSPENVRVVYNETVSRDS